MVDHLTRVTVRAGPGRVAALAPALSAQGFAVRLAPPGLVAESASVEGQAAKAALRALGLEDREFRVFVEFVRRWGVL